MSKSYRTEKVNGTIEDFVNDAFSEIESLGSELREWADNMQEKLGHTDKYTAVDEAASSLEEHKDAPDVPDAITTDKVETMILVNRNKKRGPSREIRLENAMSKLGAVKQVCEDTVREIEDSDISDEEESQETIQEINDFTDALDNIVGELEGLNIPGMYG